MAGGKEPWELTVRAIIAQRLRERLDDDGRTDVDDDAIAEALDQTEFPSITEGEWFGAALSWLVPGP